MDEDCHLSGWLQPWYLVFAIEKWIVVVLIQERFGFAI